MQAAEASCIPEGGPLLMHRRRRRPSALTWAALTSGGRRREGGRPPRVGRQRRLWRSGCSGTGAVGRRRRAPRHDGRRGRGRFRGRLEPQRACCYVRRRRARGGRTVVAEVAAHVGVDVECAAAAGVRAAEGCGRGGLVCGGVRRNVDTHASRQYVCSRGSAGCWGG